MSRRQVAIRSVSQYKGVQKPIRQSGKYNASS